MNTENHPILQSASSLYAVKPVREIAKGVTGNQVFEVADAQTAYILRASAYSPQREAHTAFELQWMAYLSDTLPEIVSPQKSINDNLFEVVEIAGSSHILCLFEKAPGKTVDADNPMEFNETLYFNLGALMGSMHRLTVDYPGNTRTPAFEWTGPVNAWRYENIIPDDDVRRNQRKHYDAIRTLPITQSDYGIIHWDIHADNFFVRDGKIKLFDFDACQFNWYAADMASAIFFMIQKGAGPLTHKTEKERTAFAEAYVIAYLKGYLQTYTTTEYWIRKIDLFLQYQMCDEYLSTQIGWPQALADVRDWYRNWFGNKITQGLPYVFIDYDKILGSIPPLRSGA